jgi:hypothetical protein
MGAALGFQRKLLELFSCGNRDTEGGQCQNGTQIARSPQMKLIARMSQQVLCKT